MTGLLDSVFAPITFSIGYVHQPLEKVGGFMTRWYAGIKKKIASRKLNGSLSELLLTLEPLTFPETKVLLVGMHGSAWTAVFLNSTDVPAPSSIVAYACRELKVDGLCIANVPTRHDEAGRQVLHGVTRFEKFAPSDTGYLNYERVIEVAFEDGEWSFELSGAEQPFETPSAYKSRRIRDRFTLRMLEDYCAAMGVRSFDVDSYSSSAILIESEGVDIRRQATYKDAQKDLAIA